MQHYVERARSAFYLSPSDPRPMSTLGAFHKAAQKSPQAAKAWLERLESISPQDTQSIFNRIPEEEISPIAINFAQELLSLNRQRLLALKRDFL